MDKRLLQVKKITDKFLRDFESEDHQYPTLTLASQICQLFELPKDKPPLLSNGTLEAVNDILGWQDAFEQGRISLGDMKTRMIQRIESRIEDQREADIKHYEEDK